MGYNLPTVTVGPWWVPVVMAIALFGFAHLDTSYKICIWKNVKVSAVFHRIYVNLW